jgi:uncharacterized protein (TIGR03437 family)
VNAASYATGAPLAPGSIVAIYGDFLLGGASRYFTLPLPTDLSGLSVQFGSVNAPLFYASSAQVILQVPWELAAEATSSLSAARDGQAGAAQTVQLAPFSPGIFTSNARGTGQGAILDSVSSRLVDDHNPAVPGATTLQVFCTGLGAVTNQPLNGAPASANAPSETTTTPAVIVGGLPAKVFFSGLEPGTVGVYRIDALVPAAAPAGSAVPVVVSVGGATSNSASIAVQGLSQYSAYAGFGPLTLSILGKGFTSTSSVTFNGTQQPVTLVSANQLEVVLGAAELATPGVYAVVVTSPGGAMAMDFTVTGAAFSLAGHSVNIKATVKIGNQSLPSVMGLAAISGGTYQAGMNDLSALPAFPQFQIGFPAAPVSTGSSLTFNSQFLGNESLAGMYQPDRMTAASSIAAAAITVDFSALAAGAAISGAFTLSTAQGTVQGNFTGTIISVN